jgi:hypothetical protein
LTWANVDPSVRKSICDGQDIAPSNPAHCNRHCSIHRNLADGDEPNAPCLRIVQCASGINMRAISAMNSTNSRRRRHGEDRAHKANGESKAVG